MPEVVSSILFIVLGATIGAVMSYIVSYMLQLRKWRVESALLRKVQLYGPIFDEMAIKELHLTNYRDWARSSSIHRFTEWDKHRNNSLGLLVPHRLRKLFESFVETCRLYNKASFVLIQRLKEIFPEKHHDIDDWVIAMLLADKILVAPHENNRIVTDHLMEQQPTAEGLESYWIDSRLQDIEAKVLELKKFKDFENLHHKYSAEVQNIKGELQSRIERIVERYQTPLKGL